MLKIEVDVFEFDELDENVKNRVIGDIVNDWMDMNWSPDECRKEFDEAIARSEQMQTPWFCGSYIYEYCEKWILDEARSALYYDDGDFVKWK